MTRAPQVAKILADHAWQCRSKACLCGWSQRASLPSGMAQLNHLCHVAEMLSNAGLILTRTATKEELTP